ncbi:uncharacterized protein A1O9_00649 [Exophiala aquamarina CBS 119918]|uniref:Lanthionine synthetase C-like protein n=1 Tax=Exophiala aquamarina CBS 119918 TaxID=1182545 RepID=A0A072PS31_9EURO|nr:uncharacterized protein A1O9_00649 [Exophiala aquamarina CBS 119918]KEF62676.1 hypothetical protein A1O9_00649 [Exophiala aquamarina CBS 119918]
MSTSDARYLQTSPEPSLRADARTELLESLTRINAYNPPVQTCSTGWSFGGLYQGPTSVAYLFYRLCQIYGPQFNFKGQSLLDWAQAYLDLGIYGKQRPVDANHCGIAAEVLAQLALRAVIEEDPSLVQKLCSYEGVVNGDAAGEGSNEWLYGRAGYLYLLRVVRAGFQKDAKISTLVNKTIQTTVHRILTSKQPWTWHGKQYLGAAHGTFGIICQVVLSFPSSASSLEPLLRDLLETQFPSGNFPSSLPAGSDKLVQFCHGGPGAVVVLRSIRQYFPSLQNQIDEAVSAAQRDLFKRGNLTKEPCLCHGASGNALALDDDAQFQHLMLFATSKALESHGWLDEAAKSDGFVGLFTGEAGRAWAWAMADNGLEKACIGFNDV